MIGDAGRHLHVVRRIEYGARASGDRATKGDVEGYRPLAVARLWHAGGLYRVDDSLLSLIDTVDMQRLPVPRVRAQRLWVHPPADELDGI